MTASALAKEGDRRGTSSSAVEIAVRMGRWRDSGSSSSATLAVAEKMALTAQLEICGVVAMVPGDANDNGGLRGAGVDMATAGPR